MPKCCFFGCNRTGSFRVKDRNWKRVKHAAGRKRLVTKQDWLGEDLKGRRHTVCDCHWRREDMAHGRPGGRRTLKANAVPIPWNKSLIFVPPHERTKKVTVKFARNVVPAPELPFVVGSAPWPKSRRPSPLTPPTRSARSRKAARGARVCVHCL